MEETPQGILELSPFWERTHPLEQIKLIMRLGNMLKKRRVRVELRSKKGSYTRIYVGSNLKTAQALKK